MLTTLVLCIFLQESEQLYWAHAVVQKQYDLAIISIAVIIALSAVIAGTSWFTNHRLIKNELNATKRQFESSMESFKEETDKTMAEIRKTFDDKVKSVDADAARLFAIIANERKSYGVAAKWAARAIIYYEAIEDYGLVRVMIDFLDSMLVECTQLDKEHRQKIESCLAHFSPFLEKEKKHIEKELQRLSKGAVEE